MKIVSDNPELLEEIFNQLKLNNIAVEAKREPSKNTDMAVDLETVKLILTNLGYFYTVREIIKDVLLLKSFTNQEHIFVELKNGDLIPFSKYDKMSEEELSELVF